jgi:oligoendopeptidase F
MSAIRERKDIPINDQWDLSPLYAQPEAWDADFEDVKSLLPRIEALKGTVGRSAADLKAAVDLNTEWERRAERLGEYAHLRTAENVADGPANDRMGRFMGLATQIGAAFAFLTPEIQAVDDASWDSWIADPRFADDRIALAKIRRYKPHVLGIEAERVLALGTEARGAVQKAFSSLTNADLDFGTVTVDGEEKPLTQSTWSVFLQNPDHGVRRKVYDQFYGVYAGHANTLAALYAGSIQQDIAAARARNFASSRARALFSDDVPEAVYDNLVASVHEALPVLHRYYELRRKLLGLATLHHCDVYAPLVPGADVHHRWDQAVDLVLEAVKPLGEPYGQVLGAGLRTQRWADRYENKGKRSGAFSAGCYVSPPYLLMNYKEDSLRDVFTLAHEAGHSMHTWHSVRANPFQHYGYTIFEAEVASTFNEQLLARLLLDRTSDKKARAAILGKLVEDTVATLFRQTMFAEFEHKVHAHAEAGGGLTLDFFKQTYRALLDQYFGPTVTLEDVSALEGLRIPHFYGAFYVYKYATGLSASLALSARVLGGGEAERTEYLNFLRSGGSRFPLESLKLAGVDMARPEPVRSALRVFEGYLKELESLTQGRASG